MIPILYEKTETAFLSNGLGRLRDCISCKVTEERNGIYECDFEYPVDGARFEDIICGRIIGVEHDDTGDIQPFDIVSYTKPLDGVVTFHCQHISYRLCKIVTSGKNVNNLTAAMTLCGQGTPSNSFSFEADFDSSAYMAAADGVPRSVRSMLGGVEGSILDTYGGEYEFDTWNVILHKSRGQDRNLTIRYGVNLTEYNEELDAAETYNAAIPYWKSTDGTVVKGGLVNSGMQTVTGRVEAVALDLSDKFETKPTAAQLQTLAKSMMTSGKTAQAARSISVKFVQNDDPMLAKLQTCRLCDRVNLEFPRYGTSGRYKIVKTVWDVLGERYEEMELGTLSTSLSEALGISNGMGESSSGTVLGELKRVGAITGEAPSTEPTLASGTSWRNLRTITLTTGVWMVTIGVEFAGNSTGMRGITLATGSSGATSSGTVMRTVRSAPASTGLTTLQATFPVEVTSTSQVFYLNAYQSSGSTLTVKPRYTAIKLGNSTST